MHARAINTFRERGRDGSRHLGDVIGDREGSDGMDVEAAVRRRSLVAVIACMAISCEIGDGVVPVIVLMVIFVGRVDGNGVERGTVPVMAAVGVRGSRNRAVTCESKHEAEADEAPNHGHGARLSEDPCIWMKALS